MNIKNIFLQLRQKYGYVFPEEITNTNFAEQVVFNLDQSEYAIEKVKSILLEKYDIRNVMQLTNLDGLPAIINTLAIQLTIKENIKQCAPKCLSCSKRHDCGLLIANIAHTVALFLFCYIEKFEIAQNLPTPYEDMIINTTIAKEKWQNALNRIRFN